MSGRSPKVKRAVAVLAIAGLGLAACGGGDDDSGDEPVATPAPTEAASDAADEESAAEQPEEATDEPREQSSPDEEPPPDGEAVSDVDAGEMTDGSGEPFFVSSLADVPDRCKDDMADFLRAIEPVVSSIDWQSATMADFEDIVPQFEALSEEFDDASVLSGCDAMEFADAVDEFAVLIEFASDVAPGTAEFFEFVTSFADPGDDESAGGADDGGSFETCDDAVAFVDDLMAEYDNFVDVPASQLMRFADLATVFLTCSPEQMAYFDSDEVLEFRGD